MSTVRLRPAAAVNVAGGATLGGQGSVGATTVQSGGILEGGQAGMGVLTLSRLTFSSEATINLTPSSSVMPLSVTGSNGLAASGGTGSVVINIGTASLSAGGYPLIGYAGTIQGTGSAAFAIGTEPSDGNFYTLKNITGGSSYLELFVALNAPYWTGAHGTAWDTSTQNWQIGGGGGTPSLYTDGVAAVFDDSAGTNGTVVISGADVNPASVTFNNGALAYTLQGTNAISGSTGLTKSSSGTLTIANINSFTGPVNFNGGTIAVNSVADGGQYSPLARAQAWFSAAGCWSIRAPTSRPRPIDR